MHEFSICQEIVETVLTELKKQVPAPKKLLKTRIVAGKLRQIVPEYMQFAYNNLTMGTIAEGSELEVRVQPIIGECKHCFWRGELPVDEIFCKKCGSFDINMEKGKELYIESMEIEYDE